MTDHLAMDWHIGRGFTGTRVEDNCPCPKEPCGLVAQPRAVPHCDQHRPGSCKTIRQSHPADRCPGDPR